MKNFFASLTSLPWLIEETWLKAMIDSFSFDSGNPKILDTLPSEPIRNTRKAKRYGDSIACLSISGPIFPKPNFLTHFLGVGVALEDFIQDLKVLENDPEIKTIIFDIDSPGGVVTGVNEASTIISSLKTKTISYVGGSAASAAYWLGSSADEMVLEATGRVGSIGVVVALPNPQTEKQWVIEMVNTKSPNKRPDISTSKGKKEIMGMLDSLADVFIKAVANNRGVTEDVVVSDFGQGGMLVGQNAVDAGMVDRLGFFEELIRGEDENAEPTKTKTKIKIEKEGEENMNLAQLKADHKDVYDALVAQVTNDVTVTLTEKQDKTLAEKDAEITTLQDSLKSEKEKNETFETRVKSLEKKDMIREEKSMKEKAENIMDKKLLASSVPERLHAKIKGLVDYNSFVSENALDAEAFGKAVDAEIKEFEEFVSNNSFVDGISTKQASLDDAGSDDDLIDRMAAVS